MEPTVEELQAQLDEAKAQLEAADEKLALQDAKDRAQNAKDYVTELSELGLDAYPGFLAKVEQIMLADDGEAALLLSEDGVDKTITATEIVKDLIESLPKGDDGKILLSQQHIQIDNDVKPPLNADGENLTQEEKTARAREFLDLDNPKRPKSVRA